MPISPGFDLLGAAHPRFPLKQIIREIPKDRPVGFFWSAFGDGREVFRTLLDAGFKTFRIQVYWSDSHKTVPVSTLEKSLRDIRAVAESFLDPRLYISPSCEHREKSVSEMRKRLKMIKQVIPYAVPVNNPWKGQGCLVDGFLTEYHGGSPGSCDLASTDGTNIYDIDAASWVKKYGNREHPCFVWGARFNLREISDPGQKPPPIPKRKAVPSLPYFKSVFRLTLSKGIAIKPKFKAVKFQAPNIWKSHSEDDQEANENTHDELRENRPVLIMQPRVTSVDILNANGKVIGKLPYFGSYLNSLNRYYAGSPGGIGLYGSEIAEKAQKTSGSEFVWFRATKQIFGPVHPAFRAGVFRD